MTATERIHLTHVQRIFGGSTPLVQVTAATLQSYIETRASTSFLGRPIKPQTIKKELATPRYVWNWACRNNHVPFRFPGEELVYPKAKLKEPFRTLEQIAATVSRGGLNEAQIRELWGAVYLNPVEIGEVLEYLRQQRSFPWLYPLCATAAHTGAR